MYFEYSLETQKKNPPRRRSERKNDEMCSAFVDAGFVKKKNNTIPKISKKKKKKNTRYFAERIRNEGLESSTPATVHPRHRLKPSRYTKIAYHPLRLESP